MQDWKDILYDKIKLTEPNKLKRYERYNTITSRVQKFISN